jgi:putative ABC transport system permease protein
MIVTYIKVAFRRIVRERVNVLIGVLSLSVGIASLISVGLYLRSELLYDGNNRDKEHIYRVITRISTADGESNFAMTGSGFGPLITGDYPQLGTYVRFRPANPMGGGPVLLSYQQKERLWSNVYIADNSVFDVFTHKILYGNPHNALENPQSIAISESVARYYFGDEIPIGKKIVGPLFSYAVTLVFADLPENTHFKYDALLPSSLDRLFDPDVTKTYASRLLAINTYTYLKVSPELSHAELQRFADRFVAERITTSATNSKKNVRVDFQPLVNQHFGEPLERDQAKGNIFYLYAFGAVSVLILLIACINYMILATARASRRAKEIGMRQVLGATRAQLAIQFLGESLAVSAVSLVVGVILAWATLRITPLASLMSKVSLLEAFGEPSVWLYILALGVLVALLAGLYPALYLSRIPRLPH